jgi:ubiquinone/menaquinone biosynthesis C-methylase UbiE
MSLTRRLEPEVMDTPAEAEDYDAMDHSAVNRVFVSDFLAAWSGANPVLDVGTGTAQIPIELCRQDGRPRVTGIDLSEEMLRLGRRNVATAKMVERIQLQKVDAKKLPFVDGAFAAVISNSIIHHIPRPAGTMVEMVRVCAKGGCLFVRDLLRPHDADELTRLVDQHAAGANEHQRQLFADSLNAALTIDEVREIITSLGFAPQAVTATSDRHWTWVAHR